MNGARNDIAHPRANWWGLLVFTAFVVFGLTALIGTFVYWNLTCLMMLIAMSDFGVAALNYVHFAIGRCWDT
jgi:hypothetical protein